MNIGLALYLIGYAAVVAAILGYWGGTEDKPPTLGRVVVLLLYGACWPVVTLWIIAHWRREKT